MRKFFLAFAVAAMATSVQAQSTTVTTKVTAPAYISAAATAAVPACKEQFKSVPSLAKRLHVKEGLGDGGFSIRMCDGRVYDLLALLTAVLDRMDKIERHK